MFALLFVALFAFFALSSPIPCDPAPSAAPTPADSTPTPSSSPAPSSPPPAASTPAGDSTAEVHTGGIATYFYQNGNAGACGNVNPDSAVICALDSAIFDMNLCGKQVYITNTATGAKLAVTVADECPTCNNANSIDLSVGAFSQLSDNNLSEGTFSISWTF